MSSHISMSMFVTQKFARGIPYIWNQWLITHLNCYMTKAPILTQLKWLNKNLPACPFLWCMSTFHVLTGILSLLQEWEAVLCQVISILSISFWKIYTRFNMMHSSSHSWLCFGLFLYVCEFSLGFLVWSCVPPPAPFKGCHLSPPETPAWVGLQHIGDHGP